jgi:DnaJ-class molecular chaperone
MNNMEPKPKNISCRLCDTTGELKGDLCEDCDGIGCVNEGSEEHLRQLKLARNRKIK